MSSAEIIPFPHPDYLIRPGEFPETVLEARALGELAAARSSRVPMAWLGASGDLEVYAGRRMPLKEVAGLTGLRVELIEAFNQGLAGRVSK